MARLFFLRDFSRSHAAIWRSSLSSVEVLGALSSSHRVIVDPATPVAAERSFWDFPTAFNLAAIMRRNFAMSLAYNKRFFDSMFHLFAFSQINMLQASSALFMMIAQTQAEVNKMCTPSEVLEANKRVAKAAIKQQREAENAANSKGTKRALPRKNTARKGAKTIPISDGKAKRNRPKD